MHLTALAVFAVKGFRAQSRRSAVVHPWGLEGDRRYLVVAPDGRFITQRECPHLARLDAVLTDTGVILSRSGAPSLTVAAPDGRDETLDVQVWGDIVRAACVGADADAWVSEAIGRPCRLVFMADPARARPVDRAFARSEDRVSFADGYPLLLASETSLGDLNGRLAQPVGMDRFRANLVIDGAPAWSEDGWRHLRIGAVHFEVVKPCARCIVTTTDQRDGSRDGTFEPIRTLQRFRRDQTGQVIFGQNLVPRSAGTVAIGDPIEILA